MEAARGAWMVASRRAARGAPGRVAERLEAQPVPRLSTTVSLREVLSGGLRLEASSHSIEAHQVLDDLRASGRTLVPLFGPDGVCREAHNAFRFRRIYVAPDRGVPFLSSVDIIGMRPDVDRYLSRALTKDLDRLLIQKWDVLVSCSGTVGNVGLAGDTLAGMALSQDAIRLRAPDPETAGFIAGYLRSRHGRVQLRQATYGSVIVHIEPEHLQRVVVPDVGAIRMRAIGREMCDATAQRDEANALLDAADRLLHERLCLPPLDTLLADRPGPVFADARASTLAGRFEAHYHDPVARAAEGALRGLGIELATLGDSRVTREVRAITKFRTRVYVRAGGIPLLSTRQLFQIDPVEVKCLAKGAHTKDLAEIALEENMITSAASGTISIGRVQIIPRYMTGWTANQHATRILAADGMNAGFLYAWLASPYGQRLITRNTYGSIILEIDRGMFCSVPVPLPDEATRDVIGELVLRANRLRDEAWRREREAILAIERLASGQAADGA